MMKEGWEYKKLGEVVINLRTGLNPRTHFKLNTPDANGNYITVRELKGFTIEPDDKTDRVNEIALQRINQRSNLLVGDVLFSGTGTIGKTALVTEEPSTWNIKEGIYAITPKHDIIDSRFLIYIISSEHFLSSVKEKAEGTGVRSIPMKRFVLLSIPIPPLPEQHRIVEYLDTQFAKIDALKTNAEQQLQAAKDLFQSALKDLMTPKAGWKEKKLNDIAVYYNGLTYKPTDIAESGYLVLRSSNIQNNQLTLEDQVRVSVNVSEKLKVHKGDIIMCSRNGSKALIGKVALIPEECNDLTFGTFMMLIRSKENPFLFYYFLSNEFKSQIWKGEATMINQITRYMLNDVIVVIPSNAIEQQQIVSRLDSLSANIKSLQSNYEQTLTLCNDLKQSLLKKIFE